MQPNYIVELTEQNFQQVLEGSVETPVLIHFWAQMSPESTEIIPALEKLAHEYNGAFTLALLNCEQQQMLAAQFGVRSLPTLALFSKGQPVDGIAGPQTEESVRELLTRHLPSQDEMAFKHALSLISEENYTDALAQLKLLEGTLGEQGAFKLALAECYVETQQYDAAEAMLNTVLMQDQDAQYKALVAKVELHKQAADTPEIRELQHAYEADPENAELAYELAIQYSQVNRQEEALELLIGLLRNNLNFADGDAKKTMMDILAALGQGNELASRYRRQLYALLY
ncbi:co-chaperone YbbN [Enterovibrio nigricans]|uniref:Putative thioredoxin n=1 Tax=Enterovibrio nigricans DSM 22720 TaxID=1121868 RepID=A0A1T4U424_9GAMM|nr:co-chaperone YbbN [Enterovibrio nigricans]PKF51857.1 co-chaperone YbbN [Enterovibrio nigricans]SKA47424.1 putative thioredoxin [Enterovibrio nigricans DSM 22720]